jgi:hypothetical protein
MKRARGIDRKSSRDKVDDEDLGFGEARRNVDDDTLVSSPDDLIDDPAHYSMVWTDTEHRCFAFTEEHLGVVEVRLLTACLQNCKLRRTNLRYIVS